jgi:predicted kinase
VAGDNLAFGHIVIADSVNPLPVTRTAWLEVARHAHAPAIEVEITCSNEAEHRRRVESRLNVDGQGGPTWQEVMERHYRPWPGANHVVDTAVHTPDQAVAKLRAALGA